jgi:hypothetical protein
MTKQSSFASMIEEIEDMHPKKLSIAANRKLAEAPEEVQAAEWHARFLIPAMSRKDFFDSDMADLDCEDLVRESDEQHDDLFLYFLGLSAERQAEIAPRLKLQLEKIWAMREASRNRARRQLLKQQGVR